MKKYFLVLSGLLLTAFSSKAQTITSGSFADLAGKTEVSVVFDYSETQVVRSKKTVSELVESDAKFAKTKEKQERYFIGSLNDDAKGVMEFGDYQNPQVVLTIKMLKIKDDMESPNFKAVFSTPDGSEIVTVEDLKQEDLNDAGHDFGKFIKKQMKKVQ
ncbi:MAG: hypothetical protein VZQ51_03900 [Bacteroidales bacterium]|nr:hypothetical protein [Bacteroidales bacterium]